MNANAERQVLCAKALGRRVLTIEQCDQVLAGADRAGTLADFVAHVRLLLPGVDAAALEGLAREIEALDRAPARAAAAAAPEAAFARPSGPPRMRRSLVSTLQASRRDDAGARVPSAERPVAVAPPAAPVPAPPPPLPVPPAPLVVPAPEVPAPTAATAPAPQAVVPLPVAPQAVAGGGTVAEPPFAAPAERPPDFERPAVRLPAVEPALRRSVLRKSEGADTTIRAPLGAAEADKAARHHGQPEMPDLAAPHPDFPFWTCETVYDYVTSMYRITRDSARIARELTAVRGMAVTVEDVEDLRREAAAVAGLSTDVAMRRKWMWRHRIANVNNIVREYTYLIEGEDFSVAKRELALEVESLLETVPADRLLAAICDALGWPDIDWPLVLELVAFAQTERRMEARVAEAARARGATAAEFLRNVASALAKQERTGRLGDDRAASYCTWWIGDGGAPLAQEEVAYIRGLVGGTLALVETGTGGN